MLKAFEVSKNKACKIETEGQKFPNLHASSESISTHFMSPCRSRQDHAVNRNGIIPTLSINKWRHQRNKYFLSIENQMFSMLKKTNFWPNPAAGFLPEWLICNNSLVHYRQNQQNMSLPSQFVPYVRQKKTCNFFFMLQFFGSHELFLLSWISYHLMGMNQLEPSCCKKRPKKYQPRNWFGEQGTSEGSEGYQIDPK